MSLAGARRLAQDHHGCQKGLTLVGDHLHIITGAPGTGKTTILDNLIDLPVDTVGEPARELIAERRRPGHRGGWGGTAAEFQELLLERSIEKYHRAVAHESVALFDRGIPDCIAYALHAGLDPEPSIRAARSHRYSTRVMVTPPWEEIYTTDRDRTMSFAMTVSFHRHLVDAYDRAGYELVEIPPGTVEERTRFVSASVLEVEGVTHLF